MLRPSRFHRSPESTGRLAAVLLLALAAAACSGAEGPDEGASAAPAGSGGRDGDWLVYGDTTEPTTLNCIRARERAARQICRLVGDSLVDFDPDMDFVPRLAESYEASDDGLTWTFRLRSGVRWHDGAPFTARDVLYSVDRLKGLDPAQEEYRAYFGPMTGVEIVDDRTIVARYAQPYADALVGWRELLIMPAHLPFDATGSSPLDRAPVGTGPFRFVSWEAQREIILDANEGYFGGRPHVDRYVHRFIPSPDALASAVRAGEIDVAPLASSFLRDNADTDDLPVRVETYPTRYVEVIYWNLDEPRELFRDRRVRTAMTLLLDRPGYISHVHGGLYRPAATPLDIWMETGAAGLPHAPREAARLLDEAGVVDRDADGVRDTDQGPMSFTLIYHGPNSSHREIGSLLERAAAEAGVEVRLLGLEWAVLRPRVYAHDFEAAIWGMQLEPRPDAFAYFHSSMIESGRNLGAYRNETFDRLAEKARRTLDPAQAGEILGQMRGILIEDQPCTTVAVAGAVLAVHRRFRAPPLTSAGVWNWYPALLDWWVPAEERKYGGPEGT